MNATKENNKNQQLSIASMNCRGLNGSQKRNDVLHYLRKKKYSIYCLQDVHFEKEMETNVQAEWGFDCYFSSYKSNSRGVAIFVNNTFEYKVHNVKHDDNGNLLALDIEIHEYRITLVNIYGPNNDTPFFYDELEQIVDDFNNPHTIICGDWNLILNENLDCLNYTRINNPNARERVLQLSNKLNLIDPWRCQNPDKRFYTWRDHDSQKQSRLDYFLVSSEMNSKITACDIKPGYRTDHSIIDIQFDLCKIDRGRGYWKLNNCLLKEKDYVDMVKATICEIVEQYAAIPYITNSLKNIHPKDIQFTINDQLFFEMLLMEIRSKTITYSIRKKKNDLSLEHDLEKEIETLFNRASDVQTHNLNSLLKTKQNELADLRKSKMDGVLIRSRTRWMEEGEKPSRYFLNMEKRNFVNKSISNIVKESNNTQLKDSKSILLETRNFYKHLYSNRDTEDTDNLESIFEQFEITKLSQVKRDELEGLITYDELKGALKKSKNDKSPGSDGFSYEFYKVFFTDLSWYLLRSINYGYDKGRLSVTQKFGVITLLPKGNKPRQFLKNWRPISLLNVTYKLASACIAERVKSSLNDIIHENQKGFMSGRYIGENIRLMYDLLNFTEENKIPGMFLLIDFEKSFDSVSHTFLKYVLNYFNFGPSIQRWINVFYNRATSSVLVNGFLSESFFIERGCRQGDGLSPYLFLLCAEVLGKMIRQNKNIKGVLIADKEYLFSQFADDTVLFLDGSAKSMRSAFNTLDLFARISGLKVNIDKTQAVWIGSEKGSLNTICNEIPVKWAGVNAEENFKALGIVFSTNVESMVNLNYENVMESIKKLIYDWSRRNLTVLGKITITKSLLLSKLTFLILTLPDPPEEFIKELSRLLYKFIWKGVDRVTRNQMIQNYENGGLRMVDIQSYIYALKATWIRRLFNSGELEWIDLFYKLAKINHLLDIGGGSSDILTFFKQSKIPNQFWKDVFMAWSKVVKSHQPTNNIDLMESVIWYNDNIRVGKKTMYYRHWVKNGVLFVNDLIKENGTFLSLDEFRKIYNIRTNFLEYGAIINALKKSCNHCLKNNNKQAQRPFKPYNFKFITLDIKGSRRLYDSLISSKEVKRKFIDKWESKLDISYTFKKWSVIFLIPFKCTVDTKLRWFQFRLTHRILGVNSFLEKIGRKDSNLCTFCKEKEETILHIFCECPNILKLWENVIKWIKDKTNITIIMDRQIQLFGIANHTMSALNVIFLLCRFYIYKIKMKEGQPFFALFRKEANLFFSLEKYISVKNGNIAIFNKKWNSLLPLWDV